MSEEKEKKGSKTRPNPAEPTTAVRRKKRPAKPKSVAAGDPNVIFIGRRFVNGKMVEKEASPKLRSLGIVFNLPDAEKQKAGFYHESARQLIRDFPKDYKEFKPKGGDKLRRF